MFIVIIQELEPPWSMKEEPQDEPSAVYSTVQPMSDNTSLNTVQPMCDIDNTSQNTVQPMSDKMSQNTLQPMSDIDNT
ncbi:hypothetical protein ACOMHN_061639 [Nucella lapillus]